MLLQFWQCAYDPLPPSESDDRMAMNIFTNLFQHSTRTESYRAGETIFRTGDVGEIMYVVQEGEVELQIDGGLIDLIGPRGIFGEMGLIDQTPRSATAIARTDCKIVPIDQKRFTFLVDETPNFALTVMRVMSDRLRRSGAGLRAAPPAAAETSVDMSPDL